MTEVFWPWFQFYSFFQSLNQQESFGKYRIHIETYWNCKVFYRWQYNVLYCVAASAGGCWCHTRWEPLHYIIIVRFKIRLWRNKNVLYWLKIGVGFLIFYTQHFFPTYLVYGLLMLSSLPFCQHVSADRIGISCDNRLLLATSKILT